MTSVLQLFSFEHWHTVVFLHSFRILPEASFFSTAGSFAWENGLWLSWLIWKYGRTFPGSRRSQRRREQFTLAISSHPQFYPFLFWWRKYRFYSWAGFGDFLNFFQSVVAVFWHLSFVLLNNSATPPLLFISIKKNTRYRKYSPCVAFWGQNSWCGIVRKPKPQV